MAVTTIETSQPLTPAGEAILRSASELFYERGIHAVGVEAIAAAAGTTKKTLYDRFGSKDRLVTAYLERRLQTWQQFTESYLAKPSRRRRYRALHLLDALEVWRERYQRGCGFVNAYAELAGTDSGGLEVIRAEKRWVRAKYVELCRADGLSTPTSRGARLALVHEGAIVSQTVCDDADAMSTAHQLALDILRR